MAADTRTVVFGGASEYRPHYFLDEQGQARGFDVDLFRALADKAGWNTEYRLGDWGAIQQALEQGDIDVAPMFISEQRRDRFLFSTPFYTMSHRLFGIRGRDSRPSLYDLGNSRVASEQAGYGWHELQRVLDSEQVVATDSQAAAMQKVARGEVDYALVASDIGYSIIERQGLTNVVALSPPLLPVNYAFAINRDRPELVSEMNRHMESLRREGVLDELQAAWFNPADQAGWYEAWIKFRWLVLPLLMLLGLAVFQLWRWRYKLLQSLRLAESESQRRHAAEQRAEKMALYDELTGLPMTSFFREYLEDAVTHAGRNNQSLTVAVLTLLDMETIQQIAGYRVFDELIQLEAKALSREHKGFMAVLGRGQFGFIFEQDGELDKSAAQMQNLIDIASDSYEVQKIPIEPQVACGIATFPDHGHDAQQVYRAAELSMTMARIRRQPILYYEPAFEPDSRNLTLMGDLNKALQSNALSWVYQPKYCLTQSRVTGAEMLVRWQHPRHGWLSPGLFIPLAEKTGLIKSLTRSALHQAIQTVRDWGADGFDWKISVNVSGNDLADPQIVSEIIDGLDGYADLLTLEVTETAIMQDVELIIRHVEKLQAAGLKISLDDYGTGYSSLAYLKQLNFDEIKLDMSFVRNMRYLERDQKITNGSIQMGHELGATIVAEGVEDVETGMLLKKLNCDTLQGFGIGKPMSLDKFINFAKSYTLHEHSKPA
ncbi:EAL domain-containing protein (putative c-di-GMP-specific phosphodiesterase class I)/ABC-type amino acid transport substrate-binding protein/GGDEF domain-containing protein [Methylohalomonas lacus]|uniref:EAL domain-containing protein (Putative c-di-GMP-specific phosphodiesterase class I)/ABC-type amino acid transport substrate-binding protein/GGDEF domain-containing protein n=1 Tax=Methylohalomonas lacus TaxID=398773 RepID=A0AAE3L1Y5_9GAMM|nr:EAL domain-containing protein [Methylohalomonas lacus]MCS3904255.1 EAL domain-containing protein (putative c-di-GMP-specific phosphodiesterase class I)/ABC-type amino acid transport substrate-binding protein/GGDEF domain-containing protein [Methylohalomonas lacus]